MRQWRSGSKQSLWARPIRESEFPSLVKQMVDDGLVCVLVETSKGYQWYIQDYPLPPSSIKQVWGLTDNQFRRLMDWVFVNMDVIQWE